MCTVNEDYMTAFKLLFETHFPTNIPSVAFTLPLTKMFLKNSKALFPFCGTILDISNISFDNSMQWMKKIRA